ncbi:hypothetical protein DVH05_002943 [Phytophthora capsici]|nr:hypothetical protein DVH05_002943 [Phytophthora capsici]
MAEYGARRRIVDGGRKPLLDLLEDQLVDLVYEKRIRKEKSVRTEEEHDDEPIRFVASDQWVQNFMARNNLTLRKRTNLTTLSDEVLVERAVSYM